MRLDARGRIVQTLGLSAALLLLCTLSPACASAWGQQKNSLFISSRADYFRANGSFLSAAGEETRQRFERFESNTYAEFGLTPDVTIGAKAVYGSSWLSNEFEQQSATGFSEIEGFVQRRLWRGAAGVGALRITGAAPARFDTGVRPGLRSDGADLEARLLYALNIITSPVKIISGGEIGYRRRFGDAADQIRFDAQILIEPSDRFLLIVETFSTLSVRNENLNGADFDVFKIQPSAVWRFGRHASVQIGLTHEAAGRGLVLGNTYFVGLWTVF